MAELVSPGVSISVTDESFYAAAGAGTVPLLVIATAQDKTAPDGAGIASATTAAEAGRVKLITSQRELLALYGNPIFKSSGGTPLHGHELNEYGLMAAYSFLGAANRAYVVRADVDLGQLEPQTTAPTSAPAAGSYWLNSAETVWGLKRWNGSMWVRQTVLVPPAESMNDNIEPKTAFGLNGDYAATYIDKNGETLNSVTLYHKIAGVWEVIGSTNWQSSGNEMQLSLHTNVPSARAGGGQLVEGDILIQMNEPNSGTVYELKVYSAGQFTKVPVVGRQYSHEASAEYVKSGLSAGDIWAEFHGERADITFKRWNGADTTVARGTELLATSIPAAIHTAGTTAVELIVNNAEVQNGANGVIGVTLHNYDSDADGNISVDDAVTAINDAISAADTDLAFTTGLRASNDAGSIVITSAAGYDIELRGGDILTFSADDLGFVDATPYSNWEDLSYEASTTAIVGSLADGTLWFDADISNDNLDIMFNDAGTWSAYAGDVQISASEPTTQSNGNSALNDGDLWISAADLDDYPRIYKRVSGTWIELDTADQVSSDGIIFADMRSEKGAAVDSDAPLPTLYPYGILAWNYRLSGGNVKKWNKATGRWDNYSGNKADGSPNLLRKARRAAIVRQLQSAIASNQDIRNESNRFNLIAAPGYPELLDDMITLNVDRKETAFIVADAPLRLAADASSTQAWATNANNATENGEDGLVSSSPYAAVYYPHGLTTNLDGSNVVVPASHIALRTLAFNDQVAFPWFAPAGFQRGVVTNATSVGYIDAASGEYQSVSLSEGQRDSLYINNLNPIGQFPGRGLAVFGQKTLNPTASALDRVNVARLVVYIRERLDDIVKPFLFEPNDEVTRQNAKTVVDRFLANLITQRGLFDFVTVCDASNNTPERIDRNELHIDIAIQPLKAVEFIYIPIRVQNTLGATG